MGASIPLLKYADAPRAIEWLCRAFGFRERLVVPGPGSLIRHAQLQRADALIMLNSMPYDGFECPAQLGAVTCVIYMIEPNVDTVFASARAAGAHVLQEPYTDEHGTRSFQVRDLEGHIWSFSTYDPTAPPA